LVPMGSVRRAGQERVSLIRYSSSGQLLGVMGAGKSLELFRWVGAAAAGCQGLQGRIFAVAERRVLQGSERGPCLSGVQGPHRGALQSVT
jgi:hypothetical protein